MLGVWIEYRTLFGRQPGIVLLVLFSGLKLLESRTHRDGAVAAFLGYFLIITNFLYTQSIPTALVMARRRFRHHRDAGGLLRAAARDPRQPAHRRRCSLRTPRPRRWCCSCSSRASKGRSGACRRTPTAGMTGLSETMAPGNLSQPRAVRRDRLPRRLRGRAAAAAAALLARAGAVGLRRPHLERSGHYLLRAIRSRRTAARDLSLLGGARAAQPALALRPGDPAHEPARTTPA